MGKKSNRTLLEQFKISVEERAALQAIAEQEGICRSQVIRILIIDLAKRRGLWQGPETLMFTGRPHNQIT